MVECVASLVYIFQLWYMYLKLFEFIELWRIFDRTDLVFIGITECVFRLWSFVNFVEN